MKNMAAAPFDRRILVQQSTQVRDAAGDAIEQFPEDLDEGTGLFAQKRDGRPIEIQGPAQELRQVDTTFVVRWSPYTATIGPETHRVIYAPRGMPKRVYEIVGLGETTNARADGIALLCSSRPDQRGAAAPIAQS